MKYFIGFLTFSALLGNPALAADSINPAPTPSPTTKAKKVTKKVVKKDTKKESCALKKGQSVNATIVTNKGTFKVKLFPDKAPIAVENFVCLAEGKKEWTDPKTKNKMIDKPLYDGTIFHRVKPNFMIQGGDPLGTGTGGPGYQFADEFDPTLQFDKPGLLAMANAGPGTNGSQFFITVAKTPWLNNHHTIFGEVTSGYEVVEEISKVAPVPGGTRPLEDVVIKSIKIERK